MPILNPSSFDAYQSVTQGFRVRRATQIVPASGASQNLFLNTGPVMLTGLMGRATAAADGNAELIKVYIGAAGATDISAVSTTVATMVVGSMFYITGVFATALAIVVGTVPVTQATFRAGTMINSILWPGNTLNLGIVGSVATNLTLSVEWDLWYVPLVAGASVAAV
jgi:hypothetical protein